MKHLLITVLTAIVIISSTSCESRSNRNIRMHGSKPVDMTSDMEIIHPSMLHNHILIDKATIGVYNTLIRTYSYTDSTYIDCYIPSVYAKQLAPLDTIHTVKFK